MFRGIDATSTVGDMYPGDLGTLVFPFVFHYLDLNARYPIRGRRLKAPHGVMFNGRSKYSDGPPNEPPPLNEPPAILSADLSLDSPQSIQGACFMVSTI